MKHTYLIGDVQGCYDGCMKLLDTIQPSTTDRILFLGDVINRGDKSVEMLDFIVRNTHPMVLGNHDFHLLACYYGVKKPTRKDTFDEVLNSSNIERYIDYLLHCSVVMYEHNAYFVHAGIPDALSHDEVLCISRDISTALQSDPKEFITLMYEEGPNKYDTSMSETDTLRYGVNAFMRMRYISNEGHTKGALNFSHKCDIANTPNGFMPWFYENTHLVHNAIYFGHWSTLTSVNTAVISNLYPLDGGYIWGGNLNALRLEDKKIFSIK